MSPKKAKGKAPGKVKGKGKKVPEADEKDEHPEDICPMVLTSVTQELFECVADEDVTRDSPFKLLLKEDILKDMRNRAAVSDFSPVKKIIQEYPEDELLLVYDRDFTYGQGFYLVLTPEAKEKLLNPPKPPSPVETVFEIPKTPEPKPWVSLGSEIEIEEESVQEPREKLCYRFSRERRQFCAPVCFSDRSAADVRDSYLECASYQDSRFSIKQMQRDCGTQALPQVHSRGTQALWVMQALQLETIVNIFCDDWKDQGMDGDEGVWSVQAAEGLKLFQTFTDQKHINGKKISCINWHPTLYGVVAISVMAGKSVKGQVKESHKPGTPSFILFYSFVDPYTPQLLLECPDDVLVFKFSPSDPNVIVGGCVNGQVVLWNISAYVTQLQGIQPVGRNGPVNTKAFGKEDKMNVVRHSAVSASKHKAPITDVHWLPQTFEVTRAGLPMENKDHISVQIVTCASDCVMFWDIRVASSQTQSLTDKKKPTVDQASPYSAPETFKHLDRTWTPLFQVSLPKIEASEEYVPLKLSFEDYTCSSKKGKQTDEEEDQGSKVTPSYSELRIPSPETLTALKDVNTKLFIGTEDGEIIYTDWKLEKDEFGHLQSSKPLHCLAIHHSFVNTVQRSPFFKDIILTIGNRNFAIWNEEFMDAPIFQSSCSEQLYTVGCWSPSRPAVFFLGRKDGSIELWNLLKKTNEPTQILEHVINAKINCMKPWSASSKQHFLAVCDDLGKILVFEIPRAFYSPIKNESVSMRKYFELEQIGIKDLMKREEAGYVEGEEPKKKPEPEKSAISLEENEIEDKKIYEDYMRLTLKAENE